MLLHSSVRRGLCGPTALPGRRCGQAGTARPAQKEDAKSMLSSYAQTDG